MTMPHRRKPAAPAAAALLLGLAGQAAVCAQEQVPAPVEPATPPATAPAETPPAETTPVGAEGGTAESSGEQGQTPVDESYDFHEWRREQRSEALKDTTFYVHLRSFYMDREKFDGSESEAWAIGGWAGVKTGYFLDHVAFGATGYTSVPLLGEDDKDGTLLLAPDQEGYAVLGELYADVRILKDLSAYVGRKRFETPFINSNDSRMTPNTFEAITAQGQKELGEDKSKLKYGAGYFSTIKERNSDEFVSMAEDAGVDVEHGVVSAGANYERDRLSIGAVGYYCEDVLSIGYAEAKLQMSFGDRWQPKFYAQFIDQRSNGDDLLQGEHFSTQAFGIKAELPFKEALFTAAFTHTTDGANTQSPWSGHPGYTSVQVQDFNRAGESAFLLRAGYDFTGMVKGLSAYALGVFGTDPDASGQFQQDEYDFNVQWACPKERFLEGLVLRLRYAVVQQDGGDVDDLQDLRLIANYGFDF